MNASGSRDSGPPEAVARAVARLRNFSRRAAPAETRERCELCDAALARKHQHLIEPATRRIVCACEACALLFDSPTAGRLRRIPRDTRRLVNFRLTDAEWDALLIPINVAFLFRNSSVGRVVAIYPSPAGPTESLLTLDTWQEIVDNNPSLGRLSSDVEALLINRLGARRGFGEHQYYLAPIDQCYRLVGLVRSHWRGLSGGEGVWREITGFFAGLAEHSQAMSASEDV